MPDRFPVQYIDPVYRPPSEANSFILPVTNGCSWNQCSFCEMYTADQKAFSVRREADVLADIARAGDQLAGVSRVFLADGDAMVLSFRRLMTILQALKQAFPGLLRVAAYCLPRNLKNKSVDELNTLKAMGLSILYVGVESGDDDVLSLIKKGETAASTLSALEKIGQSGIKSSIMVLNGLGGRALSEQHAVNTARLINQAQPDYLSTLVLTFHQGQAHFLQRLDAPFQALDNKALFQEMYRFISELDLNATVFRSDHISNRLVLKGTLGRDKALLLQKTEDAINSSEYFSDIRLHTI